MTKTFVLLLSFLLIVGCQSVKDSSVIDSSSDKDLSSRESTLGIEIVPSNAVVKISNIEHEGVINVNMEVKKYPLEVDENSSNYKVDVVLSKTGYMTQKYTFFYSGLKSIRKVKATMAPISDNGNLSSQLLKAQEIYEIPIAYPSYIPPGFKLDIAEVENQLPDRNGGLERRLINLVWVKDDQKITATYKPDSENEINTTAPFAEFAGWKVIDVDDSLSANYLIGSPLVHFNQGGLLTNWRFQFNEMISADIDNVIRGVKLLYGTEEFDIPSYWQNIDAGPFSLQLPPSWKFNKLRGTDSYVGEFVGPEIRLTFDYGAYTGSLSGSDYIITYRNINGHRAKVATSKSKIGTAGIYFGDINGQKLGIYGNDLSKSQQKFIMKIFSTIKEDN